MHCCCPQIGNQRCCTHPQQQLATIKACIVRCELDHQVTGSDGSAIKLEHNRAPRKSFDGDLDCSLLLQHFCQRCHRWRCVGGQAGGCRIRSSKSIDSHQQDLDVCCSPQRSPKSDDCYMDRSLRGQTSASPPSTLRHIANVRWRIGSQMMLVTYFLARWLHTPVQQAHTRRGEPSPRSAARRAAPANPCGRNYQCHYSV